MDIIVESRVENSEHSMESPDVRADEAMQPTSRRDLRFWLIIGCICSSLFLGALEFTAMSTALPTIVNSIPDFGPQDFIWVPATYSLAAVTFLPMSGCLAEIFGRRPLQIFCLMTFSAGCAMCGAAHSRSVFLAGRTIQGLGGGGLIALANIILADIVPLKDRGVFNGLIGITWSFASAIGPIVGGSLSQSGAWRWLFYLNLPICAVVMVLVLRFLQLRTPVMSFKDRLARLDSIGILLLVGSSTSCLLALTWGGVVFSWTSPQVLVSITIGGSGLVAFVLYERFLARCPIVPIRFLSNRTSASGYMQMFIIQAILVSYIYFMPVYFQACKGASPVQSGIDLFGLALSLSPLSIIGGISITMTKRYRPQLWFGWSLTVIVIGVIYTLESKTPLANSIGLGVLSGAAIGTAYTGTFFPVLAPLRVEDNALAISFGTFLRAFAQVWGVSVCGAVFQNALDSTLPQAFLAEFSGSSSGVLAYNAVSHVRTLPQPLKAAVEEAFATSLRKVWLIMLIMSCVGLVSSFAMRGLPLHGSLDEKWNVKSEEKEEKEEVKA